MVSPIKREPLLGRTSESTSLVHPDALDAYSVFLKFAEK